MKNTSLAKSGAATYATEGCCAPFPRLQEGNCLLLVIQEV
jgi:hypothetical protein